MILESDSDLNIVNPSDDQIRAAIIDLPNREGSFAILSSSKTDYIQAATGRNARFTLEYQEGGTTRHFRAKETLAQNNVVEAFVRYGRGDPKWKTSVTWQHVVSGITSGGLITAFHILWVIGVIIMIPTLVSRELWTSMLAGFGTGALCLACIVNILSAVLHQRMWLRTSVVTPDSCGGMTMFRAFMFLNALLAVLLAMCCLRLGLRIF